MFDKFAFWRKFWVLVIWRNVHLVSSFILMTFNYSYSTSIIHYKYPYVREHPNVMDLHF